MMHISGNDDCEPYIKSEELNRARIATDKFMTALAEARMKKFPRREREETDIVQEGFFQAEKIAKLNHKNIVANFDLQANDIIAFINGRENRQQVRRVFPRRHNLAAYRALLRRIDNTQPLLSFSRGLGLEITMPGTQRPETVPTPQCRDRLKSLFK
jgi:hypothetical protein